MTRAEGASSNVEDVKTSTAPSQEAEQDWYQEADEGGGGWVTVTVHRQDGSSSNYSLPRRTMFEDVIDQADTKDEPSGGEFAAQ